MERISQGKVRSDRVKTIEEQHSLFYHWTWLELNLDIGLFCFSSLAKICIHPFSLGRHETEFHKTGEEVLEQNVVLLNVTIMLLCGVRAPAYLFPHPTCCKHSDISIQMLLGRREGNICAGKLSSYANKIPSLHKNQPDFLPMPPRVLVNIFNPSFAVWLDFSLFLNFFFFFVKQLTPTIPVFISENLFSLLMLKQLFSFFKTNYFLGQF